MVCTYPGSEVGCITGAHLLYSIYSMHVLWLVGYSWLKFLFCMRRFRYLCPSLSSWSAHCAKMHVVFSRDILLLVLQCYEPRGQVWRVVEGRRQRRCWGFSRVGPCVVRIISEGPHNAVARLCLCVCSSFFFNHVYVCVVFVLLFLSCLCVCVWVCVCVCACVFVSFRMSAKGGVTENPTRRGRTVSKPFGRRSRCVFPLNLRLALCPLRFLVLSVFISLKFLSAVCFSWATFFSFPSTLSVDRHWHTFYTTHWRIHSQLQAKLVALQRNTPTAGLYGKGVLLWASHGCFLLERAATRGTRIAMNILMSIMSTGYKESHEFSF